MVRYGPGLLALVTLGAGLALARPAQAPAAATEAPPQLRLGPWHGKTLAVEARAEEILETDDVALVEYRAAEAQPPVWFAQVAGFGTRAAFHPPELCYVGSHYEIFARSPITIMASGRPHRVMRLVVGQGRRRFEAWYWFTADGRVTPSYYQQQLWLVLGAMAGRPMAGRLIRISTPLDDPAAAHDRLAGFLTSFSATPTH